MILGMVQHVHNEGEVYAYSISSFLRRDERTVERLRLRPDGTINLLPLSNVERYLVIARPSIRKSFKLEFLYE